MTSRPELESFNQSPPRLGNQYEDDRVLRSYLERTLGSGLHEKIRPELTDLGALAVELYELKRRTRSVEPELTQWSPWGERIDEIELTPVWKRAERLAAEKGIVATAYEGQSGWLSRVHQFALAYLFDPSTETFNCPLAMTDGAARTLLDSGEQRLIDRAVPHLTSRDPEQFWTSGQWMTESTGGSDVGRTETVARQDEDGTWRLYGRKWFTSAATSQMALTLARPEGNPPGGHGLAMFYVETRDDEGWLNNIRVNRLKDKLGTRKLPTAELTLDGTPAELIGETTGGVRAITPMLNVTRTWNSVSAIAVMRRSLALARDYARRRVAFGSTLSEKPLHVDTLAGLQAEFEGAFHLTFLLAELVGRMEHGELDDQQSELLRLATPITKLTTARQAVHITSEVLEAFGGAGYVEDTGLPELLRDAQVLPIWEGTTNVLALDAMRALAKGTSLNALQTELQRCVGQARDPELVRVGQYAVRAANHAGDWLASTMKESQPQVEAGARRFGLTLGRSLQLGLMVRHAQWALDHQEDRRPRAAALRFAEHGVDHVTGALDGTDSWRLAAEVEP
jgi:alkylation response protein AidB-like acyl-CoA dehydrogenase